MADLNVHGSFVGPRYLYSVLRRDTPINPRALLRHIGITRTHMKPKSKINVPMLLAVRAAVLAEPRRVDQTDWMYTNDEDDPALTCGTIGCIAGHVVMQRYPSAQPCSLYGDAKIRSPRGGDGRTIDVQKEAIRILRVDDQQAEQLFDGAAARGYPGTKKHARNVARHIDRFIKKHAPEAVAR